jgi:TonB family protein
MFATVALLFTAVLAFGQAASVDESKRKVRERVAPVYPELARRMSVSGKVKIEVAVTPDGHVRSSKVIGGHPLLVQACQAALKDWKFSPASDETNVVVEFVFESNNR